MCPAPADCWRRIILVDGAGGRNRTGTEISFLRIFVPATAFAAAPDDTSRVCGLDYPFTMARGLCHQVSGAARLVSTPSCKSAGLARDCHDQTLARSKVSPNLSGSTARVSLRCTQSGFKSVASTCSATPAKPDPALAACAAKLNAPVLSALRKSATRCAPGHPDRAPVRHPLRGGMPRTKHRNCARYRRDIVQAHEDQCAVADAPRLRAPCVARPAPRP